MSTLFTWRPQDLQALLASCDVDEVTPLIHAHFPKQGRVLECGCGLGRFVRYLTDQGHRAYGIEFVHESLRVVHAAWPDLPLAEGDCARSPFRPSSFDALLSLGLVEHWPEGPQAPLRDHFQVLKPGGVAIITVPLHNQVRRIKRRLWLNELFGLPHAVARRLLRGTSMRLNRSSAAPYPVYPTYGPFYEYRLTPEHFLAAVRGAGFEVLAHQPFAHIDGLYHELNPLGLLVRHKDWRFRVTPAARALNAVLSRHPFLHSHMQAIVARRPSEDYRPVRST